MANYLIDSHIFIWADSKAHQHKLSPFVLDIMNDPNNKIYLSMASLWEIQIKIMLRKLSLSHSLSEAIQQFKTDNFLHILPIHENHILALENLPSAHKDPFDRMLIAQAICEKVTLITDDAKFSLYSVPLLSGTA